MSAHGWDAIDANQERTLHHLIRLRRWRNILSFPLFRLPAELIFDIFAHALDLYGTIKSPSARPVIDFEMR